MHVRERFNCVIENPQLDKDCSIAFAAITSWLAGVSPLAYSNTFKVQHTCEASQWPILGSSSLIRDQPEGTQDQEPRDYYSGLPGQGT